jgi:hypothetical protein
MSRGHSHYNAPGSTQNQGNTIGDRPCVRQSKIGREHEGGNQMKALLGHNDLKWNVNQTEGAYQGGRVHDAREPQASPAKESITGQNMRRGTGTANQQSMSIFGDDSRPERVGQGHTHHGMPGSTQNQGNTIGDRPCVRQSKIGREHEGGNQMKDVLGHNDLKWNVNKTEGAYQGGRVHDARVEAPVQAPVQPLGEIPSNPKSAEPAKQPEYTRGRRGTANQQSYNLFTGN